MGGSPAREPFCCRACHRCRRCCRGDAAGDGGAPSRGREWEVRHCRGELVCVCGSWPCSPCRHDLEAQAVVCVLAGQVAAFVGGRLMLRLTQLLHKHSLLRHGSTQLLRPLPPPLPHPWPLLPAPPARRSAAAVLAPAAAAGWRPAPHAPPSARHVPPAAACAGPPPPSAALRGLQPLCQLLLATLRSRFQASADTCFPRVAIHMAC